MMNATLATQTRKAVKLFQGGLSGEIGVKSGVEASFSTGDGGNSSIGFDS